MTNRREFILKLVPLAGAAAVLPRVAMAEVPDLTESDPMAIAMGFVLGIFMLVGIWDGNVTYRQKVGILFGVLLNLMMSTNSTAKTSS